jgi:hypothetical protein
MSCMVLFEKPSFEVGVALVGEAEVGTGAFEPFLQGSVFLGQLFFGVEGSFPLCSMRSCSSWVVRSWQLLLSMTAAWTRVRALVFS